MAADCKEIEQDYIDNEFKTKDMSWYKEMHQKSCDIARLVEATKANEGFYTIDSLPPFINSSAVAFTALKGKYSGSRTYAFLYHIAASLAEYARDSEDSSVKKKMAAIIAELHEAFHTQLIGGWTGILPIWDNIARLKNTFLGVPKDPVHAGVFSDLGDLLRKLVDDKAIIDSNLDKLLVSLYLCIKGIRLSAEGAPVGVAQGDLDKIDSLLETIKECHQLFLENKMAKREEIVAPEDDKGKDAVSEEESSSEEEKENKDEAGTQEKKERLIIQLLSDLISPHEDLDQDRNVSKILSDIKNEIMVEIKKIDQIESDGEAKDNKRDPLEVMSECIINIEISIERLKTLLSGSNDPKIMDKVDKISGAICRSLFSDLAQNFKEAKEVITYLRSFDLERIEVLKKFEKIVSEKKPEEVPFEDERLVQSTMSVISGANGLPCAEHDGNEGEDYVLRQDAESSSSSVSSVKISDDNIIVESNRQRDRIDWFFSNLKEPGFSLELTYKECVAKLRDLYVEFCLFNSGGRQELETFRCKCIWVIRAGLQNNHGFSRSSLIKLMEDFSRLFLQDSAITPSTFFATRRISHTSPPETSSEKPRELCGRK